VCGRKIGLATSFRCRCTLTFCSGHRHADGHACTFDYKARARRRPLLRRWRLTRWRAQAAAAQQLTKANPVVVASKLEKL